MRLVAPVTARDHVRGSPDAPVELVEYGDYQCPYCRNAHELIGRVIRRIGPGLKFVFRNFPLTQIHPRALPAALLAEGAGAQGRFWPMHDLLYAHQANLEPEALMRYASALGLDPVQLADDTDAARARVMEDRDTGIRSGVNGTPTFFVSGRRYDAPWVNEAEFAGVLAELARRAGAQVG